jgi:uncharacterized protein YbcC (UPF0753/DUF2309 family)
MRAGPQRRVHRRPAVPHPRYRPPGPDVPVRLQVIVEAPRDRIDAVLAAQPGVMDLVDNGWVRLYALDPEGEEISKWVPGRGWQGVEID